jgi:hypothetical protein
MQLFVIRTGMQLGQKLGATRTGMRRLGRTRTRTGGPGAGDSKENKIVLENVQEDREFNVTRATIAIALHLGHTLHPAAPQSVWVLTTRVTYSTKYRRSGYAPGLSDKQRKQNEQKDKY